MRGTCGEVVNGGYEYFCRSGTIDQEHVPCLETYRGVDARHLGLGNSGVKARLPCIRERL